MDSEPEDEYDQIVDEIADVTDAPICLLTVVDRHRQWFKAKKGIGFQQTPLSASFCIHAIRTNRFFEVRNTLSDPRFAENPLVLGSSHIRYYAAAPLTTWAGIRIGALCILDTMPRMPLLASRVSMMRSAARRVTRAFELRAAQVGTAANGSVA